MKKVLLLVSALLIVFSGVAAVSAYEGHMVDVKAHVENAIMVNTAEADFGIVFPQEKVETQVYVGLSESFREQERYSTVEYNIYWEPKPVGDHEVCMDDPDNDGYFIPIWPYVLVKINELDIMMDDYQMLDNGIIFVASNDLDKAGNPCDVIHLKLDPPIHPDYLNRLTDPRLLSIPADPPFELPAEYWCMEPETLACGPDNPVMVPHTDLGSNLKIQVMDILLDVQ